MKHKIINIIMFTTFMGIIFLLPNVKLVTDVSAEILIIANKTVAKDTMTKGDIKKIFLGKKVKWDDNNKINVATLQYSETHEKFIKTYTGKTASQFENWWRNLVFTGKGSFPKSFIDETKYLDYVANTNGAIGYISSENNSDQVNIIKIFEK